jgi:hypothetical protein
MENELTNYTCVQPMIFLGINSISYRLMLTSFGEVFSIQNNDPALQRIPPAGAAFSILGEVGCCAANTNGYWN